MTLGEGWHLKRPGERVGRESHHAQRGAPPRRAPRSRGSVRLPRVGMGRAGYRPLPGRRPLGSSGTNQGGDEVAETTTEQAPPQGRTAGRRGSRSRTRPPASRSRRCRRSRWRTWPASSRAPAPRNRAGRRSASTGARQDPPAGPEVADRQRGPGSAHDRVRDRQGLRGRPARRGCYAGGAFGFWAKKAPKLLADEKIRIQLAVRARPQARRPLRAGGRRGRDRSVELPAHQLIRRLHPRPCRGQRLRPQAGQPHAAHLAVHGRGSARVWPAGGRLHRGARRRATWAAS